MEIFTQEKVKSYGIKLVRIKPKSQWRLYTFELIRNNKTLIPYSVVRKKDGEIVQRNWYIRFVDNHKIVCLPLWATIYVLITNDSVKHNECVRQSVKYNGVEITEQHLQGLAKSKKIYTIIDAFQEEKKGE